MSKSFMLLQLGDFTEINNNTTQDYWYDGNGNYTKDNNKVISAVTYNFMNLPQQITVTGKGTINYVYDAAGNKLQKKITDVHLELSSLRLPTIDG